MKYNLLGKTGVLISEMCLGTMTFGGQGYWKAVGELQQNDASQLVKLAFDQGINFIDTANAYSEGMAETLLGKAIKDLDISHQSLVIATKLRLRMGPGANQVGLSKLHIMDSVDDSLKRLNLSHIDLLYIHGIDKLTPLEETMRGLEAVLASGKVRYLGISNHPAWMVMKANGIAEKRGWNKFCASQNYYSIASRDIEREIVPMLKSECMALIPWSPLAGGFLSGKFTREKEIAGNSRRDAFDFPPLNKQKAFDIIDAMNEIGKKHNISAARVALAWMLTKPYVSSIIIGAKTPDQLKDNIEATKTQLSIEDLEQLEHISALTPEYPAWMIERQQGGRMPEIK
jgi:aryl-alcohol dehydrogenase-like predicted oxidoreductase